MGKAKLIKSSNGQKLGATGKWHVHDQIKPYILGIVTGDIDTRQVSGTLVSGVPTPWARAKLFWFAFDYFHRQDANIETFGLMDFYKMLIDEWKGLIALIALHPDRVSFSEPVYMEHGINQNANLFDIAGAFGRMLLEDVDIWTDQLKKAANPNEKPFIQLLKYNNQVIGGVSPFSIVFSGVNCGGLQNATDIAWYIDGRFTDPIKFLDNNKLQKLYLFISNIINNFAEYKNNINLSRQNNPLNLAGITEYLRKWKLAIEMTVPNLQQNGTTAQYANLCMPYKALLASSQKVYQLTNGSLTFVKPDDETQIKYVIDDLLNLLNRNRTIVGWYESGDYRHPLSQSAVYLLMVNDVRDTANPRKYFALPLSMEGVKIFNLNIKTLVSLEKPNFNIAGRINEQRNLLVDLTVEIDGQPYTLNSREYEIKWITSNGKILMWPDFISDYWDAYYLYSEYPLNVQGLKFVPFFKKGQQQEIIKFEHQRGEIVVFPNLDQRSLEPYGLQVKDVYREVGLDITELIKYPVGIVPDEMHKYEIIKSNRPIAGLEVREDIAGRSQIVGYLIVKSPDDMSMGNRQIVDLSSAPLTGEAIVGIDFGSNNSCVHYTLANEANIGARPIPFKNRRLALVGIDSNHDTVAERDELLFFSNESTANGQIKSWLHEHDERYVKYRDKEIAGGVAVNEKNILVKEMDREKITTQAGKLHYNMKWLSSAPGLTKKTAYLKDIWLSICADLYAQRYRPVELRWSFPGSMSPHDRTQYNTIYTVQLPGITPILDQSGNRLKPATIVSQTESEAVCKYAMSRNIGLTPQTFFLGIDVGGSTSDILLLAQYQNGSFVHNRLYTQSSVRIAAGVFFNAVIKSAAFRKAIFDYHNHQKLFIVENIHEICDERQKSKAPFYLNCVFDRLTSENFAEFYAYIGREAPFVFAIPAYVTGLLLFYSGTLCAKTIKENKLSQITRVHLLPFGKGGRLFHWLRIYLGGETADGYFRDCFRKGCGEGFEKISLHYRGDIEPDNKSEVSKGLAVNETVYQENGLSLDIFAEKNIRYYSGEGKYSEFKEDEIIRDQYFEQVTNFVFPERFENFDSFLNVFIDFIGAKTGLVRNIAKLQQGGELLPNLLESFIRNDGEYIKAQENKRMAGNFEYRFPILIAVGLCYLEEILIPEIFKS
jgi:hypothetical protein